MYNGPSRVDVCCLGLRILLVAALNMLLLYLTKVPDIELEIL